MSPSSAWLDVEPAALDGEADAGEDADDALQALKLAMRNGDAVAEPGRAQPLALQQDIEDVALLKPGETGGAS